jgi:ferredoxin
VVIDGEKCEGHARCWALCPEVFDVDDDGYGRVRDVDITPYVAAVQRAVLNCPERAIELVEPD